MNAKIIPALAAACVFATASQAGDLLEVYRSALRNDPLIQEADVQRLANREARPQAVAALLPQLTVSGSWSGGDSSVVQPLSVLQTGTTSAAGSDVRIDARTHAAKQYQLQLAQPVFYWDRWAALGRANVQVAQAEIDYLAAGQDLILRVARRYFDVLSAQDTIAAARATEEALNRQMEQAEKRFAVGLIPSTDVQEAKAARDQAVANTIAAKQTLATNTELLRELTGESFDTLAQADEDLPLNSPDPQDAQHWVKLALRQNPRLISSRLGVDIARADVNLARGGHLPSLELVVTRGGLNNDVINEISGAFLPGGTLQTPGDSRQTDTSIGLRLNFPIYSGGAVSSKVRQQVYLRRAAAERLERTARETERSTRDSYLGVLSGIARVKALKQAVESNKTALQATEAGYEVGTRTTVDILESRRRLFDAQTGYTKARYDYLITTIQLKQAAGSLSVEDLQQINGWLR